MKRVLLPLQLVRGLWHSRVAAFSQLQLKLGARLLQRL